MSKELEVKYIPLSERKRQYTNPGNPVKEQFKRVNDEDGSWHLEKTGEIDWQAMIQSAAPPEMSTILAHASRGDFSLLNANTDGIYADVSNIHDLGDVYLTNQKAQVEVSKVAKNRSKKAAAAPDPAPVVNNSEGDPVNG